MAAVLETQIAFSPVVSKAVEESATAFFSGSCGLTHVPEADVDQDGPCAGIMSTISFMGDPPWAFALAFPEDAAVTIAKAFAGFDIPFDSPDMGDVVGEIVNVIAGDISGRLAKKGIDAKMSLPTTVRGDNVAILVPSGASETRLTFSGPNGTCWFNLVGTVADGSAKSSHHEPEPTRRNESPAAPAPQLPPPPKAAPVASNAPPPPSAEALAAWAAAEAEAERELAEQDAREAAERAAGVVPPSSQPAAPSAARTSVPGPAPRRRLLVLTFMFACGGWGAAAGLLMTKGRPAPVHTESVLGADPGLPGAAPKNSLAHIDALLKNGQFAEALRQCVAAPKSSPEASETALALREGLCLESDGRWVEAAKAYRIAEADPNVVASLVALLGQARCAARDESYALTRTLANRVLLRSGHPACRGLKVREEVRHLRAQTAVLESGTGRPDATATNRPSLSTSATNCLDWLATSPAAPVPVPARDVLEVHRTLGAPGALQVTVGLAPRPTIAVMHVLGSTAGWKVQADDGVVARLNRSVGPLEVDHMPLSEFLDVLTEGTRVTWAVQTDTLVLAHTESK